MSTCHWHQSETLPYSSYRAFRSRPCSYLSHRARKRQRQACAPSRSLLAVARRGAVRRETGTLAAPNQLTERCLRRCIPKQIM